MTRELLQQALIEVDCYLRYGKMEQPNALANELRSALAQPASEAQPERENAEPVAMAEASGEIVWIADEYPLTDTPLYLGPPNRRS